MATPRVRRRRLCRRQTAIRSRRHGQVDNRHHQAIGQGQRLRGATPRWVVERTFAWLGRCRRLAKDWEKSIASSTAWALIASIRMVTCRTARYCWN
ncbi:transposase [Novosphingobium hassiacum]|uniref:transposase n=1 Tax=Novosphingobium hassiacum TaxID=173676 RepID=UPI003CCD4C14